MIKDLFWFFAKVGSKSSILKKLGAKLAIYMLPEEVETRVNGSRFVFHPKTDGVYFFDYSNAEPGMYEVIRNNLNEKDCFVDVGAYTGIYSIFASRIVGDSGRVISFEPNPEAYRRLQKNIKLNGYRNITVENLALSNEEGHSKLFTGKHGKCYRSSASSMFRPEEDDMFVTVKTITFDKYCQLHRVTPVLIKIDAEGAEYKILMGMQKVIDMHHPKLLIEVHSPHLEKKQGIHLSTFFEFLDNKGYEIHPVEKGDTIRLSSKQFVEFCKKPRKNEYRSVIPAIVMCK